VSLNKLTYKLPANLASAVTAALNDWKSNNKVARMWAKDASVWTGADEGNWLGWLSIVDEQIANVGALKQFGAEVKKRKFKYAILLGMGGSSLCPEVLRMTFGKVAGFPEMHVLDSTDPVQIKAIEKKLDLKKTLCIVSSKSGSTLEPNIFKQYFFEREGESWRRRRRQPFRCRDRSRLQNAASG
jgi:transaldolase/glucose-6-phosphate isomerase